VDWPASLLTATTRPSTVLVAPAHGLTLTRVDYPPDAELASRTAITRNIRM
jgi:tRNA pseudouridine38-40 synthase